MIPIDVLSLTANIIQVVESAIQVSQHIKEQYQSADGMVKENSESLKIVHDIRKQHTLLKLRFSSKASLTEEEEDLLKISNLCDAVSESLESELQALILPDDATHRRTKVVKLTLRARRRKRAIFEIRGRLMRLRIALDSRLMSMVKVDSSYLLTKLDEVAQMDRNLQANTSMQLSSTKDQIIDFISSNNRIWQEDYGRIADLLIKFTKEEKEADKALQILKRLRYLEHSDRYNNVSEAHRSTFQWIFDNQNHGFPDWLQHQSGIYWICGKPGSGKSTLIKFIEEHDETARLLKSWAGDQKIVVASHYFWTSGSSTQCSREGFLRSIIFQILRKHPVLIPEVFPQQWLDRDERELGNLSPKMLEAALGAIVDRIDRPKICFFIDGLDEYDCAQDEIIGLLKRFEDVSSVKLCVSSRPWENFEHAFHSSPKCRVHELTEDDIRKFTRDTIANSPDLMVLMATEFEAITNQIVQKSSGVFFWVFLVVRMLLSAPAEGATLEDLQMKIHSYPTELEALFDRIYKTIKGEYRRDAARMLKMCLASYHPTPLAAFQVLEKHEDHEFVFRNDFHYMTRSEVHEWKNRLEKRINARCKDFVHITETDLIEGAEVFVYRVQFLHRTARDYLKNELMPKHLENELRDGFDASLVLAQGALMALKCSDLPRLFSNEIGEDVQDSLSLPLLFAQDYEEQWGQPLTRLIDEVDHVVSSRISALTSAQDQHWSHLLSYEFRTVKAAGMLDVGSLFALDRYVLQKLQGDHLQNKANWNLLMNSLMRSYLPISRMDYRLLVGEILRHGANVNETVPHDGRTVWEIFLNDIWWSSANMPANISLKSVIGDTITMLLRSGADPNLVLQRQDRYEICTEYYSGITRIPEDPRTIKEVVRRVLPCQASKILPVLEQKRKERAGLSSSSNPLSNPGKEFGPTPQATIDSPAPTNPQQNRLTKMLNSWNPFNLWTTAPTQQRMLEDKLQEDGEASASQGSSRVATGA